MDEQDPRHPHHLYQIAQEPYIFAQMPYISAKEPYISAREPCISAKEPYIATDIPGVHWEDPRQPQRLYKIRKRAL